MARENIECIVTGFDPFGDNPCNPSQLVVEDLPTKVKIDKDLEVGLTKEVLSTSSSDSWKALENILTSKSDSQVVLLMLGLADTRANIEMERVALNLRDYPIPDNRGSKPPVGKIYPDEENALFNNLELELIKARLNKKKFSVDVSNHAGTYVCNEIYYRALNYRKNNPNLLSALFVHLPSMTHSSYTEAPYTVIEPKEQLKLMQKTVLEIIKEIVISSELNVA